MRTIEQIKTNGYKWQVGWYTENGNYHRIAIFKNKPSVKTLERLSREWNLNQSRMQAQVIQGGN